MIFMNKIALGLIFLFNIIKSSEQEKVVYVNQQFEIHLWTPLPKYSTAKECDDHIWKDEDYWKLINFDSNVFTLLDYYSGAPDFLGRSLNQSWVLKAKKPGNFNFVFKKYSDEKIIQVNIIALTLLDKIKLMLKSLNSFIFKK